jgi:hypothetical protein
MTEQDFWDILFDVPDPKPVFFRLYYNSQGHPLFYSMEDLPGTYIEIDADAYARSSMRVRVKDGKIVEINCSPSTKLTPGNSGTPCHANDIVVVVDTNNSTMWSKKTYEEN